MLSAGILAFTGVAVVVVLMPGADTVLVLRTSLRDGPRSGVATALGVTCGPVVWGALAGVGVALLLGRNRVLYDAVAVAGGVYLGYLAVSAARSGIRSWRSAGTGEDAVLGVDAAPRSRASYFRTGLTTNLLNPKIGVFYLAVMPGLFAGQAITVWLGALLGLIHGVLGLVFLSGVSVLAGAARRRLLRPRTSAVIELLCGACLLGFGLYVIAEAVISSR